MRSRRQLNSAGSPIARRPSQASTGGVVDQFADSGRVAAMGSYLIVLFGGVVLYRAVTL